MFGQALDSWAFSLLIFARVISVISIAPIFGGRNTPVIMRIGFSAVLALIFSMVLHRPELNFDAVFLMLLPGEVIIGLGIGYMAMLIFNAIQMAGQLIDTPMGFSMVNVFNPSTDTQLPVMGDFYYVLAMLLFLATNAHHLLIGAIFESYARLGLGQMVSYNLLSGFGEVFMRMFLIGVKISIPAVGVMLMSDAAIALLSRTVPSINAFIMGAPIKIAFGVTAMLFSLGAYVAFATNLFHSSEAGMLSEIMGWLRMLGGY